jgi:hypothetical protein
MEALVDSALRAAASEYAAAHEYAPAPDDRVEWQLARAEIATAQANRAAAEQQAAIREVLAEARRHPEVYVNLRGEATPRDLAIAVDAAVGDLAARLSLSETTVAALAHQAETLQTRAPQVWAAFREGELSAANARATAQTLDSLPRNLDADALVDARALELASLVPARFRERLRVFRERVHPVSLTERHEEARDTRSVWCEHDRDAMAEFGVRMGAADCEIAWQRVDAIARSLARREGETRTLDQLRADVARDILTGRNDPATEPRVQVGVLVPVLTLLGGSGGPGGSGDSGTPAMLDGRIPIDDATAREWSAHAPSFHRILTHPVSGAVLDVDRRSYRPPADLKRWLELRDGTCRSPGCGIPAKRCDLDHTIDWARGGPTSSGNLGHLSERHHTRKHDSKWQVEQRADGIFTWTSPTGFVCDSDPPPF